MRSIGSRTEYYRTQHIETHASYSKQMRTRTYFQCEVETSLFLDLYWALPAIYRQLLSTRHRQFSFRRIFAQCHCPHRGLHLYRRAPVRSIDYRYR